MSKNQKHPARPGTRRIVLLLGTAIGIVVVALASLWFLPELLLAHWVGGGDLGAAARANATLSIVRIVALSIGGIIAIVGVAISVSRHHEEVTSNHRDQARLEAERDQELRSRYVTAVELLSDAERPIKRIAGLHALGSLADDWQNTGREDEVQVCINTICDYLRQPPELNEETGLERTAATEVAVRTTGYDIIRNHLLKDAPSSWSSRIFRLAGAYVDYLVDLSGAGIADGGRVDLSGAKIADRGGVDLSRARIADGGRVDLRWARITDGARVDLSGATIADRGGVDLSRARISDGGRVGLREATIADGGRVDLSRTTIKDGASVDLSGTTIKHGGSVNLDSAQITDRGRVDLSRTTIKDGGSVDLSNATIADEGSVDLSRTTIANGGSVDLLWATITDGGSVKLRNVTIKDRGSVDLAARIKNGGSVDLRLATIKNGGSVDLHNANTKGGGSVSLDGVSSAKGGKLILDGGIFNAGI